MGTRLRSTDLMPLATLLAMTLTLMLFWGLSTAWAGSVLVVNKSPHKVKVSSIGGKGYVGPNGDSKELSFKNDDAGADIIIWWVKDARQLCKIYTPWDRTITVTGKHLIACMSRN